MNPNLSLDARERVFAAASQLFEESGRQTMPTVDQVRRLAKNPVIQTAWARGPRPQLHAWVYRLDDGELRELLVMSPES